MTAPLPDLGALLHASSGHLWTLGDRVLGPLGVTTPQWKVLVLLARGGEARVSHLVAVLQHDQAATSRLVARMEQRGLLVRAADPSDARVSIVRLTAQGRSIYAKCDVKLRAVMGRVTAALGPSGATRLRSLLARFTSALQLELAGQAPLRRRRIPSRRARAPRR